MAKLIYSVEDNENIREIVACAMEASGMDIVTFGESKSMFASLDNKRPDLILLDIMLPDMDGVETLKILKSTIYHDIPVIMVSAKTSEYDKVTLLDMGASDYITKPFGVLELIARVKANLKRQQVKYIAYGKYLVNDAKREISYMDNPFMLTVKEYETLRLLIMAKGEVVDKDFILKSVWGDDYEGETRTLNMVILRLRAKLQPDAIETVRNIGFRLRG